MRRRAEEEGFGSCFSYRISDSDGRERKDDAADGVTRRPFEGREPVRGVSEDLGEEGGKEKEM